MLNSLSKHRSIAFLAGRIIIGGIFVAMGWMKVSDMATTIVNFSQIGITPFWTYIASYAELVGGAFIVLGLFTEYAAAVLAVVMAVAMWKSRSMGLGGVMPPLAVFGSLMMLIGHGAGKFALSTMLAKKHSN